MSKAFTIKIFYPNGDSESMRVAHNENWTGKVFYIARDYWAKCVEEYGNELENPGVYVLVGQEDDQDDLPMIYIGESEKLVKRINDHVVDPKRKFFERIVCVTGTGFNKTHFKWMESHLISLAQKIARCTLDNSDSSNKPQLSKSEEADVMRFIAEAIQIFPIMEVKAFAESKKIKLNTGAETPAVRDETPKYLPKRIDSVRTNEIRNQVISIFQSNKNIELFKRSKATFYDASHTFRVCCSASKKYNSGEYWFSPTKRQLEFLEKGKEGYFLFGMVEQSKAICLPVAEFLKIKSDQNSQKNRETNQIVKWYLTVEPKGDRFILPRINNADITNYTFDIAPE